MPQPLRVLILEDRQSDARLVINELKEAGFEPIWERVETEQEFLAQLDATWDIILADYNLPQFDALQALRLLGKYKCKAPLIIVSGTVGEETAVAAMREGAADYLLKDRLGRLGPAVSRAIENTRQSEERTLTEKKLLAAENLFRNLTEQSLVGVQILQGLKYVYANSKLAEIFGYTEEELYGLDSWTAVVADEDREMVVEQVRLRLSGEMPRAHYVFRGVRKDRRIIDVEVRSDRIEWLGQPAVLGMMSDITERKLYEKTLAENTRLSRFAAKVGSLLVAEKDLRTVLFECTQVMVDDLDAAFARIWTLNAAENVLQLQASAGLYTHLDGPHARVPVGAFKIGRIAQERVPHLTNDVPNDPRVSDHEWAKREGMVAFAGYPLIVEDRLVGVMAMFARHPLTPAILDAMAAVSNQIAAGIERKRTEEKLRLTQFTIDHVGTPVFWADAEGRFFNVNDAACRLTGYTREELTSLHVPDVDPSISRQNWPAVWKELQIRGTLAMESNLRRKDGTNIPVSVSSNLLQAEGREFSCTFLQDITERRQAEEAQQQSEARFRVIFNQLRLQIDRMPLAYILFDAGLRVVDWNPAAERIFGYRKEEVLGMEPPFAKIVPRAFWTETEDLLRRIRTGDMSAHSVNENLTKDGRTITCEWLNTPLELEDGRFNGLMCLAQDVTERKHLEEQFRQAQKMEAIGRLAGGVAHDFNNLLTIILGYSEVLQESLRDGDPLRELVEQIHTAGNRASGLTRQLLAFSRKQMLTPIVLDLNSLVSEMEKMLGRLIGEDIELTFHPAANLWRVRVDAGQMEQILMNLVVNSRDAMPQGGKLTIETANVVLDETYVASHPDARVGEHVLLGITDTGCGMDRATLVRVFEPFFSTKGDKGTGLGLATVYGIVKQSGGHVTVSSELGHSTSFRVYLPRDTQDATTHGIPAVSMTRRQGTETVLLVEDEDGVRTLARITLQREGYKVLEARHGGEALLICERHPEPIQLLATDVVMPNMSGRELAERLLPLRPALKVLYISGYMDDAIVRHGLLTAGIPFLQKPYTPDALARKVREVLDRSRR